MKIATRLFGKKIKGEALENLLKAIGKDPDKLLQINQKDWKSVNVHGRVSITPVKEGLNVDLYVFRTDYFEKANLGTPHIMMAILDGNPLDFNDYSFIPDSVNLQPYQEHLKGEIKY